MIPLVVLSACLMIYAMSVGADFMSHKVNAAIRDITEDGLIAGRFGANFTVWLRLGVSVALVAAALADAREWGFYLVSGVFLAAAYWTAGVAWRNFLITIGRGDLERNYERTFWSKLMWIKRAWE